MEMEKTRFLLRLLAIESFLTLAVPLVAGVVSRLEGERTDTLVLFAYLFAGLIGVSAYQVASRLHERIGALERGMGDGQRRSAEE